MIDESQRQQLTNEIINKVEEVKRLKKELRKLNQVPRSPNYQLTMLPVFKQTRLNAKECMKKYKSLTGLTNLTWNDFINILVKLCTDYMNSLTNAKENESPNK